MKACQNIYLKKIIDIFIYLFNLINLLIYYFMMCHFKSCHLLCKKYQLLIHSLTALVSNSVHIPFTNNSFQHHLQPLSTHVKTWFPNNFILQHESALVLNNYCSKTGITDWSPLKTANKTDSCITDYNKDQ